MRELVRQLFILYRAVNGWWYGFPGVSVFPLDLRASALVPVPDGAGQEL